MTFPVICPVCQFELNPCSTTDQKTWKCANNHSFDVSKQGYLNLLLANQKNSSNPGDDLKMVKAREIFLERARYLPLLERISSVLNQRINTENPSWADLGCGEGWYTRNLKDRLDFTSTTIGLDISKPAITSAARQSKSIHWQIASAANPPISNTSLDFAISLFTPLFGESTQRILKESGLFLVAGTGANHLIEMRELIYDEVNRVSFTANKSLRQYFDPIEIQELEFSWVIESEAEALELLTMTPHAWRTSPDKHSRVHSLKDKSIQAHFVIELWQSKLN